MHFVTKNKSLKSVKPRMSNRAVASGGASGARPPPFETGVPHFTFGPSVAACIQHCILKMWPRSDF